MEFQVPYKAIFWVDIPLQKPYIGLIYGRYLQFGFLEWPLIYDYMVYGEVGWEVIIIQIQLLSFNIISLSRFIQGGASTVMFVSL